MLSKSLSNVPPTVLSFLCLIAGVSGQCNPLTISCTPALALGSSTYSVDFTQQTSLPLNWTVANYETVTYGPNGAEFTFAKRYDAPYIWTNFYVLFGRVDTVVQAAPGAGMISSSVLISDDLDEIDWEWSGNKFDTSTGKVQTNYYGKGITGNCDRGTQPSVDSPLTIFHTYTVDWTPTALTWSVDGAVLRTMQSKNAVSGAYQYPQTPMRVQLGLWDAGDADTAGGTVWWAGGYTNIS
jgi:beta-glucanase (GH16 family)